MPMHLLHAQNAKLTGKVFSSEDSKPLEDVNIYVKDLKIGSATDLDGQFSINQLPFDNIELDISILGYRDTTLFLQIEKFFMIIYQTLFKILKMYTRIKFKINPVYF